MRPGAVIVDYGVGNLLSVSRALERCGAEAIVSADAATVEAAERLVLPGVGAFGDCMRALAETGLAGPVRAFLANRRPMLGICVGMQMLFDESEEFGCHRGLGLIPGRVTAIPKECGDGIRRKVPHIGWSALLKPHGQTWKGGLMEGIHEGEAAYFLHSYAGRPADPAHCLAECDYLGERLCAVVRAGNVYGCQFHPEKSGPVGLRILSCFLSL